MEHYALHGGRRFFMYFTDVDGAAVDPTSPVMDIMKPGSINATADYSLVHASTGAYYKDITDFDEVGTWTITRRCSGGAMEDELFEVLDSRFP